MDIVTDDFVIIMDDLMQLKLKERKKKLSRKSGALDCAQQSICI